MHCARSVVLQTKKRISLAEKFDQSRNRIDHCDMAKSVEGPIKKEICDWLASVGAFYWMQESVGIYDPRRGCYRKKNSVHQKKGVSDVMILCRGDFIGLEIKAPKGRISPEQKQFIAGVEASLCYAFVVRSLADAQRVLAPWFNPTPSADLW